MLGVLIGFLLSNWQKRITYSEKKINEFVIAIENYYLGNCKKINLLKTYIMLPKYIKDKVSLDIIFNSTPDELEKNCLELIGELNNAWKP